MYREVSLLLMLMLTGSSGAIAASARSSNIVTAAPPVSVANFTRSGPLSAAERAQIQAVGQALLLSNQSVRRHPDSDAEQLRQQVTTVQAALAALIAPIPYAPVRVTTPSPTATRPVAMGSTDAWLKVHAAGIARLRQAATTLSRHTQVLQQNRAAAKDPGLLKTLSSWFNNTPVEAPSGDIVTPVTDAALIRIATLPQDIEKALTLPLAQRQQRLTTLSEEFRLRANPYQTNVLNQSRQIDVPTLVIRHSAVAAKTKK